MYWPTNLASADADRLRPLFRTYHLSKGMVVAQTGEQIRSLHFPLDSVVSLVVGLSSGEQIEIGTIGRGNVFGAAAALGDPFTTCTAVVLVAGSAMTIDAAKVAEVADQSPSLRSALQRQADFLFAQAKQIAACNLAHSVRERMARWLLRCDALIGRHEFFCTQEEIAAMLGVRRTSICMVGKSLQRKGIIMYRRGRIRVLDASRLEQLACECHGVIETQHASLCDLMPNDIPLVPEPASGGRVPARSRACS